jgi:uncharacterized protein CbrC (UPF0167 family)
VNGMSEAFPNFRYHPDPIATGSVEPSEASCICCGQHRGFIYVGPVYSEAELNEALCPWCIDDGSAARTFDAAFTDRAGVGDYGRWERVSDSTLDEVSMRTPGFNGWQQERWLTCCGDAAVFLGPAGRADLESFGVEVIRAIQRECGLDGDDWAHYFGALDRDGSPTAYLFRCPTCDRVGGYSDCD